jgi:hypothetical protein
MNVKELRKAYATLGLDENATLSQARDAYLTWVCLLDHPRTPPASVDPKAVPDLLHHELDLAWHAIEQAHQHGIVFPRQPRGCQDCGRTPAVRVNLHSVAPGRFRSRTRSTEALLCRECGLATCRRIQRENLRRGWWGVLAPLANVQAIGRNSTERAFLRRLEPPAPQARARRRKHHDLKESRGFSLLAGLAAIALLIGIVLPGGSDSGTPMPNPAATTAAVGTATK